MEDLIDELKNELYWKEHDYKETRDEGKLLRLENQKLKRMLEKEKIAR